MQRDTQYIWIKFTRFFSQFFFFVYLFIVHDILSEQVDERVTCLHWVLYIERKVKHDIYDSTIHSFPVGFIIFSLSFVEFGQ